MTETNTQEQDDRQSFVSDDGIDWNYNPKHNYGVEVAVRIALQGLDLDELGKGKDSD